MATNENLIPIPGRLHSVASEGHVAGADEIYDDTQSKDQATINSEVQTALGTGGSVDSRIATAKSEIIGDAAAGYDTLGELEDKIQEEASRATVAEGALQQLYNSLTQSDIVVVADHTAVSSPAANTIYRERGTTSYSDWMYYNNAWQKMAEYNNAIDDEPTAGSDNLVKSGGVKNYVDSKITGVTFLKELTSASVNHKGCTTSFSVGDTFTESDYQSAQYFNMDKLDLTVYPDVKITNIVNTSSTYYGYVITNSTNKIVKAEIVNDVSIIDFHASDYTDAKYVYFSFRAAVLPVIYELVSGSIDEQIEELSNNLNNKIEHIFDTSYTNTEFESLGRYTLREANGLNSVGSTLTTESNQYSFVGKYTIDNIKNEIILKNVHNTANYGIMISICDENDKIIRNIYNNCTPNTYILDLSKNINARYIYFCYASIYQIEVLVKKSEYDNIINTYEADSNNSSAIKDDIKGRAAYYFDDVTSPQSFDEDSYLDSKLRMVPKGKSFIFVTDTHLDLTNYLKSNRLIAYAKNRLGIKTVVFGGDAIGGELTKYLAANKLSEYSEDFFNATGKDYVFAQGNHDANWLGAEGDYNDRKPVLIPDTEVYKRTIKHIEDKIIFDEEAITNAYLLSDNYDKEMITAWLRLHYYYDDNNSKIRYIVLETGNRGISIGQFIGATDYAVVTQAKFLRDSLLSCPLDYSIVVVGHQFDFGHQSDSVYWGTRRAVGGVVSAFKAKKKYNVGVGSSDNIMKILMGIPTSDENLLCDFSESKHCGSIIMINGHFHYDAANVVDIASGYESDEILDQNKMSFSGLYESVSHTNRPAAVLNIQTDCCLNDDTSFEEPWGVHHTKTQNTVTEQCFDIITITDENKVVCTRIGAGVNREFYI